MIRESFKSVSIVYKYARNMAVIYIAMLLISSCITPFSIIVLQRLIDNIGSYLESKEHLSAVILYLAILAILLSTNVLISFFNNIVGMRMNKALANNLNTGIIHKLNTIEYPYFEDAETHNAIFRVGENFHEKIRNIFIITTNIAVLFITLVATAVVFTAASPWFLIGFFFIIIPMIFLNFRSVNMMSSMFNNQSIEERKLKYFSDLLSDKHSLYELKVYRAIDYIVENWRAISKRVLSERMNTTIKSQKLFFVSTLFLILWTLFVTVMLILLFLNGNITIGQFIALFSSVDRVLSLSDQLSNRFTGLSQNYAEINYFEKLMRIPMEKESAPVKKQEWTGRKIAFNNVTFSYPNSNQPVLKNVSFEINQEENIALVGENGAGKSTIIKLLCNFYKPDEGTITIDGIAIDQFPRAQLRQIISAVFQDYTNYSLTLRENVAFGDISEIQNDELLKQTMKEGMAQEILEITKENLDIHLGKIEADGIDLSGGQWQRIAVARACLSKANYMILDEPTSALDPLAESHLYETFLGVLKNKGVIIVSHRLASARLADRIIVLNEGSIIETGTHEELIQNNSLYSRMYTMQSSWYTE